MDLDLQELQSLQEIRTYDQLNIFNKHPENISSIQKTEKNADS